MTNETIKQKLLSRIKINKKTGCWEWVRSLFQSGYGSIITDKKQWRVHRLAFALFKGKIPKGKFVLHRCDNKKCINPAHLFLGTQKDNIHDMVKKGRRYQETDIKRMAAAFRGFKVMINGETYPSLRAAGRALNVSNKTITNRINAGWKGYRFLNVNNQKSGGKS